MWTVGRFKAVAVACKTKFTKPIQRSSTMRATILKAVAVAALVFITAVSVQAQTWDCGERPETVTATLSGRTLTISGSGNMTNYTYTPPWWLDYRDSITNVVISNGVTSIGRNAFVECTNLTTVTISDDVTSIGEQAFELCKKLTSVTVSGSVTSIGKAAFANCTSLTSVTIGNSVIFIGESAFMWCTSLKSVTIGNNVTSIRKSAFSNCTSLTTVTIPNSVTFIGESAFNSCTNLTTMTIPNNVTSIETGIFYGCTSLTTVTIPNSVTYIGESAFIGCKSLTAIMIPNNVTSIGSSAFSFSGLISVTIPNKVTSIGNGVFDRCNRLTNIEVENGNALYSSVDGVLFNKVKDTLIVYPGGKHGSYIIPNSVTTIRESAFQEHENITSVTIPNSVTYIGDAAFAGCSNMAVTIPTGVISIGKNAFVNCNGLKSVVLTSATTIGYRAFGYCFGLTSVTISSNVISIGDSAFYNCTRLSTVYSLGMIPPSIGVDAFNNMNATACLFVPQTAVNDYRAANVWNNFSCIKSYQDQVEPSFIFEEFAGTSTPAEWIYSGFSRQTSGGYNNSAGLRARVYSSSTTASVTIPNVALGDNPVLSYKRKTTNYSGGSAAATDALNCTISVSTDGTTWTNVATAASPSSPSTDFLMWTHTSLSNYTNRVVSMRITFTRQSGDVYVWLDDVTIVGARYTVTFDANGGTITTTTGMTGGEGWSQTPASLRTLASLPTPTRTGYIFEGWFTAETGGERVTTSTEFSADATVYARWTSVYTVTFNANGGIITPASATTGTGGTLASLPTPTRTGYTFDGWFTAESGGDRVTTSTTFNANVSIYARWTLIDPQVPSITTQPLGGAVTTGATRNLTVAASTTDGGTLNYQWYSNTTASNAGGTAISGATNITYAAPINVVGVFYYYVIVTNSITNDDDGSMKTATVTSNVAILTVNDFVNAQIPSITTQPQGGTVSVGAAGATRNLTIAASVTDGSTLNYQWYANTSASNIGGTAISGATGATYAAPIGTAGTFFYYVTVTNTITNNGDGGAKTAMAVSNTVIIIVNAIVNAQTPVITAQPQGGTVTIGAAGATHNLTVVSVTDGGTLSYQWYRNTTASKTGGTAISGATSATYAASIASAGTYYYYVVVTNTIDDNLDGGVKLEAVTSNVATLTVNTLVNAQIPSITAQPQGGTVIVGATGAIRLLTVSASVVDGGTLTYQWYKNKIAILDATDAIYEAPMDVVGTFDYYVVVTNTIADNDDGGVKSAMVTSNTIALNVESSNTIQSSNRTIPNGNTDEIAVVASINQLTGEFSVGPNPVLMASGAVAFFWQGKVIASGTLYVYGASGNVVRKISIDDNAVISQSRRVVGSWNLTDSKGRQVPEGTYLVKGKISTVGGKSERVSVIIGVR